MTANPNLREAETRLFFAIANALRVACRNGDETEARYCLEEIEAVLINSDNAALRDRCAQILCERDAPI